MKRTSWPSTLLAMLTAFVALNALVSGFHVVAASVPTTWLSDVRNQIVEEEYHVTWQDRTCLHDVEASWHAPNRSHGFRSYFTEHGVRVIPRSEDDPSWEWGLSLVGYGRGGHIWPVRAAELLPDLTRIDYDRGQLVEWYVNDTRGLKQGFTLFSPPEESGTDGTRPLSTTVAPSGPYTLPMTGPSRDRAAFIQIALTGNLEPVFSTDGRAIDFRTGRGVQVIHFAELRVTDVTGSELNAWMEGFSEPGVRGVRIVFDDREAAYPVTIDPLATSPAWLVEGNSADAYLGFSVMTAGDVNGDGYTDVIVGAYGYDNGQPDEGRALVYPGTAAGLSAVPEWAVESDEPTAKFGYSVSTAGDVNRDGYADVVVGAYGYSNGQSAEGRAFVYHGSALGPSTVEDWTAEGDQADAWFGVAVATAGDVDGDGYSDVIIGADGYDNDEEQEGRAFIFYGSASGLSDVGYWTAESDQASARFGHSVSTAGDVNGDGYADVIVGAYQYDNWDVDEGQIYVFHGSADGPSAGPNWTAESNVDYAWFGRSVSTAGDVNGDGYADVIAGAPEDRMAVVYHGSAGGLSLIPDWTGDGGSVQALGYGYSVSTAGDVNGDGYADVVVGAPLYHESGLSDRGAAYIYLGSSSGLGGIEDWKVKGDQAYAQFGKSVSTAGDINGDGYADVIVGAHHYDNGEPDEGRAFAYHGSPNSLSPTPSSVLEGEQAYASLGTSLSTAGDVNGDGFADVIVGAPRYDNGEDQEGRAYVFLGSASGLIDTPAWTVESNQADAQLGWSVATAGDVNGDGYSDVVVGAHRFDSDETDEGRAYVFHGSASGLATSAAWDAESNQAESLFGVSVGTAGDTNGDGYSDVIVGASQYDNVESGEGRAFLYYGSATGLGDVAGWIAESDQESAHFGGVVSTAGDVNGDGHSDVIVGASGYDNGEDREGRAYVFHGSASGLGTEPAWTAESDQASAYFGCSVSTAGDVNGDGFSDVIVGANYYDNIESGEGAAFVFHGSTSGLEETASWTGEIDQAGAQFGKSVSTAADVNGDGYADVIVGAHYYDNGETNEGGAFVYHGSSSGLSADPAWTAESNLDGVNFGNPVSTAGDVDGDGDGDVIVAASGYDNGETNEGAAFVFYGNNGLGVSLKPQQRRADDTGPIARLGHSRSPDGFRLAAIGRSPFGRARVKIESEVKAFGQPLDGTGMQSTESWSDTDVDGVQFNELVPVHDTGPQHWRMRLVYDPVTSPFLSASRWFTIPWDGQEEADLVQGCLAPQQAVLILTATRDDAGNPTFHFQDPNPAEWVTGYNVYRSSAAAIPLHSWTPEGTDVQDEDPGTVNVQWTDTTGDASPSGIWHYQILGYNNICNAEGPR